MTSLTIRKATQADLPDILNLYVHVGVDQPDQIDITDSTRVWERIQGYPNYHVYVAVQDEEIVGTFALLIMDNLAHQGAPSGVAEDVVVAPAHQGQGIGKAMMRFAMDECRKAGCYKLCLSSNLKREAAHRFYEGLGFQKHGYSFIVDTKE